MRRSIRGLAMCCVVATFCVGATSSASARAPMLLQGSYVGNYFQVRPALMSFYSPVAATFTSYITGPGITRSEYDHGHTGSIRWAQWNEQSAVGRGEQWEDDCSPRCVGRTFVPTPMTLRASRVRRGRYTRLALTLHPRGLRSLTFRYQLLATRRRFAGERILYWGTRTVVAHVRKPVTTVAAPRLPTLLASDGNGYRVRPTSIYDTGDGSGVVGVLRAGRERGAGRGFLHWKHWGAKGGDGIGTYWLKLGTPVATSPFTKTSVRVVLTRVRYGHFTRMNLRYRQAGHAANVTLCVPDRQLVAEWGQMFGGRCG